MLRQYRTYDVKYIESDSHPSIYTMFVLGNINAMIYLKQISPLVLICVETNWVGSLFAMSVLGCRDNNNNYKQFI